MTNSNRDNIEKLQQVIYGSLDPLITQDYCLLDIPDHNNIGDNLIWAGEIEYLKRFQHRCLYSANLFLCQLNRIPKKGLILLHGGGNFGDVWRDLQDFRLRIISNFPESRIVIFPQTVHYKDLDLLKRDAEVFNRHPDLTICARDTRSFEILKQNFTNNKILLVPDMAFCLNFDSEITDHKTNRILLLERSDRELKDGVDLRSLVKSSEGKEIDVKDWPTFNGVNNTLYRLYFKIDGILSKNLIGVPVLGGLIDPRYGIKRRDNRENYLSIGVDFINQYDEIYSTRLHVFILGTLLNKPVHIIDNSYGKNSTFYNTWLKEFRNLTLVS